MQEHTVYEFCVCGTFDIHSLESCNKSHTLNVEKYYCLLERERSSEFGLKGNNNSCGDIVSVAVVFCRGILY